MIQKVVHNLALGAALIALIASLWQDWTLLTTVKRMVISYMGFFFLGALMALAVKLVTALEKDQSDGTGERGKEGSQIGKT